MRLRLRRIVISGAVGLIGLSACAESPSRPTTSTSYYVYAGMHQTFDSWIAVIDTETDSLVDSLVYEGGGGNTFVVASADGKYVAGIPGGFPTRVWDAATGHPIQDLDNIGEVPLFLNSTSLMTTSSYQVRFYSLPGFELDTTLEADLINAQRLGSGDTVIAIDLRGSHAGVPDQSQLAFISLEKQRIIDSFVINPNTEGLGFRITRFDARAGRNWIYALGNGGGGGPSILALNLITHQVEFRNPVFIANGHCRVSPDGAEVWYTDPGSPHPASEQGPGLIVILDASTGTVLDTIHTIGFYVDPLKPLAVQNILFVPGEDPEDTKAYVNCGSSTRGAQPLLVIDYKTREIEDTIFADFTKLAEFIAIGPKP